MYVCLSACIHVSSCPLHVLRASDTIMYVYMYTCVKFVVSHARMYMCICVHAHVKLPRAAAEGTSC